MKGPYVGVRLFFSASIPTPLKDHPAAVRAPSLVMDLLGALLVGGGTVVCGGHPTITPLLDHLVGYTAAEPAQVELHQLRRFPRGSAWAELGGFRWHGAAREDGEALPPIGVELTAMRQAMAADANAAVFVGGEDSKHSQTDPPGLQEEFDLFRAAQPEAPVYLSGLLEGYTAEALIPAARAGRITLHDGLDDRARALAWGTDSVETFTGLVLRALRRG